MPTELLQYGGWGTTAIVAALYVMTLIDKRRKRIKQEENASEDRLIDLLQKEVLELTKKVNKQDVDIKSLTIKVDELQKENRTLIDILQGRDGQTQQMYKDAYGAIEVIRTIAKSSDENNKSLVKLTSLLEGYTKATK